MENILDKKNSTHIRSYEGIRDILFKRKKGNKYSKITSVNSVQNEKQQPNRSVQTLRENNPSVSNKKGKPKFHDLNTYTFQKKQKEG